MRKVLLLAVMLAACLASAQESQRVRVGYSSYRSQPGERDGLKGTRSETEFRVLSRKLTPGRPNIVEAAWGIQDYVHSIPRPGAGGLFYYQVEAEGGG